MRRREVLKLFGLQTATIVSGGVTGLFSGLNVGFAEGLGTGKTVLAPQNMPAQKRKGIVVFIIQRGAMDGLSMVAPIGDPQYLELRPNIHLDVKGDSPAINLDGFFALHPELRPLEKYWHEKTLLLAHQVGSPDPTRSHFDAQDYLETGTPGVKVTQDGFLNRTMQVLHESTHSGIQAVALQSTMPRSLQGPFPAISMLSTNDFDLKKQSNLSSAKGFEDMYSQATDKVFRQAGSDTFQNMNTVRSLREANKNAKNETEYPKSQLAGHLKNIASLIKADLGLEIAVTEMGGWDTHVNQGNGRGQLGNRFKELAEGLAAFITDLGPRYADVCIVTQTEFGRTVKENGTRGTDHGHGSVQMFLGANVNGGKVHANWKDLKNENLFEGRDLPVTTDARLLWSEVLHRQLGLPLGSAGMDRVFPAFHGNPANWLGVLKPA